MKTILSTLALVFALAYTTTACTASFSYSIFGDSVAVHGSIDETGTFTYYWSFGEGPTQTGQNSGHRYANQGTFNICLYVTNSSGCSSNVCHEVVIPTPACEASFVASVSGMQVGFQGTSNGSNVYYHWDYGDGQSGTGQMPYHTYANYGHYQVCLTVYNGIGCQATFCDSVFINPPCQAYFNYTTSTSPITFNNYSQGSNLTYSWDFGDGTTSDTQTPTHSYDTSGTYHVCLTIHNSSGCESSFCHDITVTVPSNCEASYTYTIDGNVVTFAGSSTEPEVLYYWHFGDGTSATGQNITHTFSLYPEHYNVCLIIVNNNIGCQDSVCQSVYVQTGPPDCEASFTYTITGTEVHFHGESNVPGVTYHWNFGDQSDANGQNVVHNYTLSPEHYVVCLTIYNGTGCEAHYCDTIFIESTTPEDCHASFTYNISGTEVHFHGQSNVPGVNYGWHFGDGTTGGGENPVHNYAEGDTVNVCLIIYNTSGCENTFCQTIIIPDTGNGTEDCHAYFTYVMDGNVVAFHGMSNVTGVYYYWSFGDGTSGSGENVTHTFTNYPEHYIVCLTVYNGSGCQNTYCQTIYIQSSGNNDCHASFTSTIIGNSVHFLGASTQNNVDYSWIFGDGTTGTGQDPTHTYTLFPEHYNVCLIISNNTNGCHDTICQTIYIQGGTQCSAEFTYTITGNEVHFQGPSNTSGTHYQWSFGDGSSSDMHNPNHVYTLYPEYYEVCLTVTNTSTNCSETVCHNIHIQQGNGTQQYVLSGTIYTGQNYADYGYVLLIQYNPNTGMLWAAQTVGIGANGHYEFDPAPAGNYFLKAALSPNSSVYANFLPTYFEHELFWYNADVITLTSNLNRNIHLIEGNNPGGPGFIGGLVTEGANKAEGPGDPVEDVQVMLLSMNDDPLQCTYSNAYGEFSFSNVAYGTYQVYGEVYNLTTIPAIVTVDAANPSITDIGLLITSREVTTGVDEPAAMNESTVGQVFPNPFKGDAAINITLQNNAVISVRLFDIAGRLVYTDILNLYAGVQQIHLPVSGLNKGIYSLSLFDEKSNSSVTRKLVKIE